MNFLVIRSILMKGKSSLLESTIISTFPLENIYSDVWTYYVIFVDHFTKSIWFYPLSRKSDVHATFVTFKKLVENYFSVKIKTLYTDNGGEYLALWYFLSDHGITHLTSPLHTPKHNGYVERRHRHIVETGLALLHRASLPINSGPLHLLLQSTLLTACLKSIFSLTPRMNGYFRNNRTPKNYGSSAVSAFCGFVRTPYTNSTLGLVPVCF